MNGPDCPKCGGVMALRESKRGHFWGCKKYPECNGTHNINEQELENVLSRLDENAKSWEARFFAERVFWARNAANFDSLGPPIYTQGIRFPQNACPCCGQSITTKEQEKDVRGFVNKPRTENTSACGRSKERKDSSNR